jgi:hypothetical protein
MSMRDLTRRIKYLLNREEFANDLDERCASTWNCAPAVCASAG